MIILDRKNNIKLIITILAVGFLIFTFFYYNEIVDLILKAIGKERANSNFNLTCKSPSCNSENSKQYCLNGKWGECSDNEICLDGGCVFYQPTLGSDNKNNKEAGGVACVGEGCTSSGGGEGSSDSNYKYILTIKKDGTGFGTITTNGGFICELDYEQCTLNYADASTITATANPLEYDSTFSGWNGCDSVDYNVCTLDLNSNETITVTFDSIPESH